MTIACAAPPDAVIEAELASQLDSPGRIAQAGGGTGSIAYLVSVASDAARPGAIRQTLVRDPIEGGKR